MFMFTTPRAARPGRAGGGAGRGGGSGVERPGERSGACGADRLESQALLLETAERARSDMECRSAAAHNHPEAWSQEARSESRQGGTHRVTVPRPYPWRSVLILVANNSKFEKRGSKMLRMTWRGRG